MTSRQRLVYVLNRNGLSICSRPDELATELASAAPDPDTDDPDIGQAEAIEPLLAAARLNLPLDLLRVHRHPQHVQQTLRRYGRHLRDEAQLSEEDAIQALLTWLEALHEHLAQQQQTQPNAAASDSSGAWGPGPETRTAPPSNAPSARGALPHRFAAWFQQHAGEFQDNVIHAFARMRERRLLYKVFFFYTILFAIFVTMLLGFLYGFMLGNIIGYFLELNMFLWLKIGGFTFGSLSLVLGLYLFFADMRQQMEGQPQNP